MVDVGVVPTVTEVGAAVNVSAIDGLKLVIPPAALTIVADGEFVPHQLSVAFTVELVLNRFAPEAAVLLAIRLKLMVRLPAPLVLPVRIPPPLPAAELPAIVTLVR